MSRDVILALLIAAAREHDVPLRMLRAVCTVESGLRADGALCGVRAPRGSGRRWREDREQPDAAAHALARWRALCGSWPSALVRFHTGRCGHHGAARDPYVRAVQRVLRQPWDGP